jgi:DNA-binding MarR family transcriptional regulator
MSSSRASANRRSAVRRLSEAGRSMSDAAVLFHTEAAEHAGLGLTDWKTLGILERYGPLSHGDLVARLGLKPASVTNVLDRLEHAGWVGRVRDEADARRIRVEVNREKVAVMQRTLFSSLGTQLEAVYARYTATELELIAQAFEELAVAQHRAADTLRRQGRA